MMRSLDELPAGQRVLQPLQAVSGAIGIAISITYNCNAICVT